MKQLLYTLLGTLLTFWANAQDSTQMAHREAATGLRADGKVFVVVTIAIVILLGLILYVFRLDRKLSRLEKQSS